MNPFNDPEVLAAATALVVQKVRRLVPDGLRRMDMPMEGGLITLQMVVRFRVGNQRGYTCLVDDQTGEVVWTSEVT